MDVDKIQLLVREEKKQCRLKQELINTKRDSLLW